MNKRNQEVQLQSLLSGLSCGVYLLDTDLSDSEIEQCISRLNSIKYHKEELVPSKGGSPFELLVIGLCRQFECPELNSLKQLLLNTRGQQKENVIFDTLIALFRILSAIKPSVLHLVGDIEITAFTHVELGQLKSSLDHHCKTTIILCKQKKSNIADCDKYIESRSLKINTKMEDRLNKVHITYKHNDQYKDGIEAIKTGLDKSGIPYSIDEYDILYRDDIQEYEKEIGKSNLVIMFVIPEYLKSIDCMFEMTQIFINGNVNDRIFPVVDMGSIPRNGDGLTKIKDYWKGKIIRKADQIKSEPGGSAYIIAEIKKINDIIDNLNAFWDFIVHKYTGDYNQLVANDAEMLVTNIKESMDSGSTNLPTDFTPSGDTAPVVQKRIVKQGERSVYIENHTGTININ